MSYEYSSHFSDDIQTYISLKCSLGYSRSTYDRILCQFDRFCRENYPDEKTITQELTEHWCCLREGREHENGLHRRILIVRNFAKYLNSIGKQAYIIPDGMTGKDTPFVPYIFTDEEIRLFFEAADTLPSKPCSKNRGLILPVIFRILFCCGLRPQEVLRIRREHMNLLSGTIYIEDSKVHKDRVVAMSDELTVLCARYDSLMQLRSPDRCYFFQHPQGGMYSIRWLQLQSRRCWRQTGISFHQGQHPRNYDWRHNFATRVILGWLDQGKDIYMLLPYLSSYMGHSKMEHTLYYVHLIPGRLSATGKMDWDCIPEVPGNED